MQDNLSKIDAAYFSVSDFQTGEHKCVFAYTSFENQVLTISNTTKVTHLGYAVCSVTKYTTAGDVYNNALGAVGIAKGITNPSISDTVEVCSGTNSNTYENSVVGKVVYEDVNFYYVEMTATEAAPFINNAQVFVFKNTPNTLVETLVDPILAPGVDDSVSAGISTAKPITTDTC